MSRFVTLLAINVYDCKQKLFQFFRIAFGAAPNNENISQRNYNRLIQNEEEKHEVFITSEVSKYTDTGTDTDCVIATYFGPCRLDSRTKGTANFIGNRLVGLVRIDTLLLGAA
jgi:hypothetical protein